MKESISFNSVQTKEIEHFYMRGFLFNTLSEAAPFEPLFLSPGNYNSFGDNKTSIYKTI